VAAGKLAVVAEPPVSAHAATYHELVGQGEPAAERTAGGDHQHLVGLGAHARELPRGRIRRRPRFLRRVARAVGHLQDRHAHPYEVTGLERPRGDDSLVVHEGPVRRPEVLDREPPIGPARDARVAA
jgi:hypothetical protein